MPKFTEQLRKNNCNGNCYGEKLIYLGVTLSMEKVDGGNGELICSVRSRAALRGMRIDCGSLDRRSHDATSLLFPTGVKTPRRLRSVRLTAT